MSHAGENKGRDVKRKLSIIWPSFTSHCSLVIMILTTWKLLKFTCSSLGKMMLSTPWCSTCLKAYHLKYDLSSSVLPIKYKLPCPLMFTPVPWCLRPSYVHRDSSSIRLSLFPSISLFLAVSILHSPAPLLLSMLSCLLISGNVLWSLFFFSYCLASRNFLVNDIALLDNFRRGTKETNSYSSKGNWITLNLWSIHRMLC